jgi:2-polyprenyl-3-methyl-5-hydroxy-6-metoxy-1,4-benzoquinol methylase
VDDAHSDRHILEAWAANAEPWTRAVREGRIGSRTRVTDRALLETIAAAPTTELLDVGCGEGWLARALAPLGVRVTGIDAVPELVERARAAGGGHFFVLDYEALAEDGPAGPFDAVVCNFSLLGEAATDAVVAAVGDRLTDGGRLIIQTLHPPSACGAGPYRDGWRDGTWTGIEGDFAAPAPWYFRTLAGWVRLLTRGGFTLSELREPVDPATGQPASVIFVATPLRGR